MVKRYRKFKMDVTVNGSGFDNPSSINIDNEGELPTASMEFPEGAGSRYRIQKTDVVRVYIGLDAVPEYATFTGYKDDERGLKGNEINLSGILKPAVRSFRTVDDNANFDGQEISCAIETIKQSISALSWVTTYFEKTSPVVCVPKDTRYPTGVSNYELIKLFRDMAIDPSDPIHIGRYTMFQHGDNLHFRKIPNPSTATPSITLSYGDSLLHAEQDSNESLSCNACRAYGKDGAYGYFANTHRVAVDGLREAQPVVDTTMLTDGECFETARATVLSNLQGGYGYTVRGHELLECIPNYSVIGITGAPYGLSDNYLLRSLHISAGKGQFDVSGNILTPSDVVSTALSQLLGLEA